MKPISIQDIVTVTGGTLLQGDASLLVVNVTTDSREAKDGTLFVPIVGERRDGHEFIPSVFEQGAVCTFTEREKPQTEAGVYIRVENSLQALQDLAAWYRNLFSAVTVIGVTGSVGKTTTKEMIAAVLEKKYRVLKTYGNMNSQIGLARMMFELDDEIEVAVIEMGISEHGEMDRLVHIARPELAVLTNVGMSHIGNLGSRENICIEKSKIITCFPKDGTLYVCSNGDGREMAERCIDTSICEDGNCQFVYYGTENNPDCIAENITVSGTHMKFIYRRRENGDTHEEIRLSVLGEHNVNNAVIALCLGERFHVPMSQMKEALFSYQPLKMRGDVLTHNGYTVIDDTYNASTDSIISGLSSLFDRAGGNRSIAVLADVLELGEFSKEAHERVGEFLLEQEKKGRILTELVTFGENSALICNLVKEKKSRIHTCHFDDKEELIRHMKEIVREDDVILVKGSRGMAMDKVVKALVEE